MPDRPLEVTGVRFTRAPERERQDGLLGWVRCELAGLVHLDGLSVRRTRDGRRCLAFPRRRDGTGRMRSYVAPVDDATRLAIEQQVFEALDRGQPEAE